MSRVDFSSTIKGGLPVEVTARIYPSEPDVGINHAQVEITEIRWPGRKGKPVPDRLWDHAMTYDRDDLIEAALEEAGEDDRY